MPTYVVLKCHILSTFPMAIWVVVCLGSTMRASIKPCMRLLPYPSCAVMPHILSRLHPPVFSKCYFSTILLAPFMAPTLKRQVPFPLSQYSHVWSSLGLLFSSRAGLLSMCPRHPTLHAIIRWSPTQHIYYVLQTTKLVGALPLIPRETGPGGLGLELPPPPSLG